MSDGVRNTLATVANVVFAVAVPALIATQSKLDGNYQGVNKLSGLVSKNLNFDLNNYKGCEAGQLLVNGVCIDEPKDQVECGMPDASNRKTFTWWGRKRRSAQQGTTQEAFSWSGTFDKGANGKCSGAVISKNYVLSSASCHAGHLSNPLDFENSLGSTVSVTKVSVPSDDDSNRLKAFGWLGRKRRAATSHDISLHETATAIWNAGDDIVPVCINRPSVSLFSPHEVVMTGFDSQGLTAETGVIVPTSDDVTDLAVATLEDNAARKFAWFGRKRRAANEEYCLENDGNRGWKWGSIGRKRRSATPAPTNPTPNTPECFANEGDSMLFQYPTGQYVLGGILQGQGSVEADDSNRGWKLGLNGRKRRSAGNNVDAFAFTNVLDYAAWIYQTSGVWSKIEEQPASAFNPSDFSPENWKGDYPEFGLADLSRSLESVIDALPALQIINDNSVEQLVDMLSAAPAANQASGLDQFLCSDDGNRKVSNWFGRKRRSANNNQCLCGSEQAQVGDDGNRKVSNWFGRRKRDTANNNDQCLDLNLDDLPVCGLNGGDKKLAWFGRKKRDAGEEQCIGDSNLGYVLGGLLDNNGGDKKLAWFG